MNPLRPQTSPNNSRRRRMLTWAALIFLIVGAGYFLSTAKGREKREFSAVGITGVQHIGPDFSIGDFYIDGISGSNVGREGGGGRYVCCVLLPKKWRPGLSVELRWSVSNWSKENQQETDAGNYKSITWECFKARVPIEKYDTAETVYVHFFAGGKARIVSSGPDSESTLHPVLRDDLHAADSATTGTSIPELFTAAELAEMRRASDAYRAKYGDWR